ncbi:glycoside hydrolase family 43 protein [Erythrobacter sp. LQ02-29]|uniref:glycoside hydrolase family 43 protein n=1 Tax=Erythrobacter sp. LQ02-29 TaxID=2920384 RepID=UPI001F4ED46D|nr:glycoside hydrolase family 43 protein [Erythrobacter sp. LQ02-29]MCP9223536.1 glycoside hydrolase family 43 protein [Erythrobacter sp. LQ02-29]
MGKARALRSAVLAMGLIGTPVAATPTAYFDSVSYRALEPAPDVPAGDFRNPILPGFQPDPSIVKVGSDFYLVTSTFSWFPGLPIYHSTDLVHWRQIGNAIDRTGMVDFAGLGTNRGLFAPAISHHDGKFWIANTCIECGGNFVITAKNPAGPWSDPVFLDFGGIDPSLVFEPDGSAWIAYNDAPAGEPRYEGHRALWLQRFDPNAMKMMPERHLLVDGGVDPSTNPVWAEGPHIYRVGDWYYLMAAEGGTADQHSETIYRSRTLTGPYQPGPNNPILTQRDLPPDRRDRVEATGHADLVQLDDGSWWGVFLATRPFAGQSTLLGRETFLLPVTWDGGWPTFLPHGKPVPLQLAAPDLPRSEATDWREWREEFTAPLSDAWIGLRTPDTMQRWLVETGRKGRLALIPSTEPAGGGKPSFVGRRLRHENAAYETHLDFAPGKEGDFAGLLALMDESHFLAFGREGDAIVARIRSSADQDERGELVASAPYRPSDPLDLRMEIRGGEARLEWRKAGEGRYVELGAPIDIEPLATIHAGLFTGLVVGPYAVSAE